MKRLMILGLTLSLLLFGCAGVKQIVGNVQQVLCNPTVSQQMEAAAVIDFITSGINVANYVVTVPITVDQAKLIFGAVQAGGCVLLTDLQMALAWFDEIAGQVQAKAMMGGKPAFPMVPDTRLLHQMVK